jgi:aryl-alcohol dehydrogenase-like predicted oxidoreductase
MARVSRRRPYPGAPFELSKLAMAAAPSDPSVDGSAAVALLRRAWRDGISVFDTVDVPNTSVAEALLARAFPDPDPTIVVLGHDPAVQSRGPSPIPTLGLPRGPIGLMHGEGPPPPHSQPFRRLVEIDAGPSGGRAAGSPNSAAAGGVSELTRVVRCRTEAEAVDAVRERQPCLLAGELSMLRSSVARSAAERAPSGAFGWIARDPFAGGRLDGSWFDRSLPALPTSTPRSVRELEAELASVLPFRSLVLRGRRTLAQAALRFVVDLPWVVSVCIPMPRVERWEEIVGFETSAPLDERERAAIEAMAAPPSAPERPPRGPQ